MNCKKIFLGLFASFTLATSFNAAASGGAQPEESHVTVAAVQEEPRPQASPLPPLQDETQNQERLDRAFARLDKTQLGKDLLRFARENDVEFTFDPVHRELAPPQSPLHDIKGLSYSNIVYLNPSALSEDHLLLTLVHELRHVWQAKVAQPENLGLDLRRELILDRMREADAFAFQVHFAYEHRKETEELLAFRFAGLCDVYMSKACLTQLYDEKREQSGLQDAYASLLEAAFLHVRALSYDQDFLYHNEKRWKEVAASPEKGAIYEAKIESPSSDQDFIAALRRMTVTGLSPGAVSAIEKWPDEDLLSLEKMGGISPALSEEIAKGEALRTNAIASYRLKKKQPAVTYKTGPGQ